MVSVTALEVVGGNRSVTAVNVTVIREVLRINRGSEVH